MQILKEPIGLAELTAFSGKIFGNMTKAVIEIRERILSVVQKWVKQ